MENKKCKNRSEHYYAAIEIKRIGIIITSLLGLLFFSSPISGQCPTPCLEHSLSASTTSFPLCGVGAIELIGNIDNNSDCEDANGDNCYEFIITRPNSSVMGFFADIGQGNGCNGEADIFYTLIDGVCTTYPSAGSQNNFNFEFGVSNEMRIYICDGSSGQVSICNLCADVDCPDPTAIIQITQN
jgi:hypothetical protein